MANIGFYNEATHQEEICRTEILLGIRAERERQEKLREAGKFSHTCATPNGLTTAEKLCVLAEEFGEVAKDCTEGIILINKYVTASAQGSSAVASDALRYQNAAYYDKKQKEIRANIRKELIQVAAVCVAWIEAIDRDSALPRSLALPLPEGGE